MPELDHLKEDVRRLEAAEMFWRRITKTNCIEKKRNEDVFKEIDTGRKLMVNDKQEGFTLWTRLEAQRLH